MNKHLKLVREFNDALSFPQAGHGENVRLSEMDVILRQALLMEEGSLLLRAIKAGDMVDILAARWLCDFFSSAFYRQDQSLRIR